MATVTRYWRTDSSGGDGTTNNTSGATAAYATLNAALSAEQTDLVTDGDILHLICTTAGTDTTTATVSGYTTGASNYILIECQGDARNDGVPGSGYINSRAGNCLTLQEDYVRLKGLELRASGNYSVLTNTSVAAASDIRFDECCFTSTYGTLTSINLVNMSGAGNFTYNSCLIISENTRAIRGDSATSITINNCTMASGGAYGTLLDADTTIYNTVSIHNGDADRNAAGDHYTGLGDPTGTHNASEDGTADDFTGVATGAVVDLVPGDAFTSPSNDPTASPDYTLKAGSALIDAGTTTSGVDITGTAWTGNHIGCFNYASASSIIPQAMHTFKQRNNY